MDLKLKVKSVILTAASQGLGKASAMEFAKEGAHVLIASRNANKLKEAVEEIKRKTNNRHVKYIVCDVKNHEQIKQMVQKAVNWNGTVDVLVNNTGGPEAGSFDNFSDHDWQETFELILLSTIRTIREVLPYMKKQKRGHIVNIASSSTKVALDDLILSNTFRPALLGLAKSLSQELSQDNIFINTIGPGTINTERIKDLNQKEAEAKRISVDKVIEAKKEAIPAKRLGKPEEFAKALVFLSSGANTYITGQMLIVDGGLIKAL